MHLLEQPECYIIPSPFTREQAVFEPLQFAEYLLVEATMVALEQPPRLAAIGDLDRLFGKILDAQYISPRTRRLAVTSWNGTSHFAASFLCADFCDVIA